MVYSKNGSDIEIIRQSGERVLRIGGKSELFDAFDGIIESDVKHCPLTNANAKALRKIFQWANPSSHKGRPFTVGLGDRLGLASKGHIRLIREMDVFPVLAQQSIRELGLTGRTYDDVLSAAVWAVFEENYQKGWGADGDHLKTREEVKMALECGFTMITLDCSEHIPRGLGAVVEFAAGIYDEFIRGKNIDFELSIDETQTVTTVEDHQFVAESLYGAGVELCSLAPRFCGEFQKGIDYRGDVLQFERELYAHNEIAKKFGYKLSIHSGSDKFTVYPAIYRVTGRNVHIKTAGTNWLEALRVIAQKEPALFREIHKCALETLPDAKKYYHITENTANIPDLVKLGDEELPSLLNQDDARQVLHVTYGFTLGKYRDGIYAALSKHEQEHYAALGKHIGRHIIPHN